MHRLRCSGIFFFFLFGFFILFPVLVHLSRKLKCTIVILRCPSSLTYHIFDFSSETEFNEYWQEARRTLRILTGSSTYSTKFVFIGPFEKKTRWPPRPLTDCDIFDFSSETTEWYSTKLERKEDLNVLYQVCGFRADRKDKMATLASDWLRHFRLLLCDR